MFVANGLDLGHGAGEAWTRAVWGALTDDDEVQAMSSENTGDQLAASPKFKDKVTGAVVAVASDSALIRITTMPAQMSSSRSSSVALRANVVPGSSYESANTLARNS